LIEKENVQPICLPWADESDHVNESVYLTGWGQYNSSNLLAMSSVLRKMKTTILSVDECRLQQFTTSSGDILNDEVICTEHRYCHVIYSQFLFKIADGFFKIIFLNLPLYLGRRWRAVELLQRRI
jgi:hypothetical protein